MKATSVTISARTGEQTIETCEIPDLTPEELAAAVTNARSAQEQAIRTEGQRRLSLLSAPYRPDERETWTFQRDEALVWQADNSAPTPFCDTIAQNRGIPRELFLPKVIENSTLFFSASATILGQQQALLDQLSAVTQQIEPIDQAKFEGLVAAISAVVWP